MKDIQRIADIQKKVQREKDTIYKRRREARKM